MNYPFFKSSPRPHLPALSLSLLGDRKYATSEIRAKGLVCSYPTKKNTVSSKFDIYLMYCISSHLCYLHYWLNLFTKKKTKRSCSNSNLATSYSGQLHQHQSHPHDSYDATHFCSGNSLPFGNEDYQPKWKDTFGRIPSIHIFLSLKHFSFADR